MVRSWLDSMIFKVFSNLSDSMILFWMAMQVFMRVTCRLLFITGKNAQLMVVTVLKKCSVGENLLYQALLLCLIDTTTVFVVVISMDENRKHYIWSALYICDPRRFLFTQCSPSKPKYWTPIN